MADDDDDEPEYDNIVADEGEPELTEEEMAERQRQLQILMENEESSDEDSVPDRPQFDLELKWYRVYPDKEERVEYTKIKCIVPVRITDTVGDLRRKVKEFTELSSFKLIVSETGEELLQDPAELDDYEEDDDEDEDEDDDEDKGSDDDDSDFEDEKEDDEEMVALLASPKELKDKAKEDKKKEILVYDKRTLDMIGLKEPPGLGEEEKDSDDEEDDDGDDKAGDKENGERKIDASFLPRDGDVAEGKDNGPKVDKPKVDEKQIGNVGAGGAGGGGEAKEGEEDGGGLGIDGEIAIEGETISVTIEIEETDESLDDRILVKQESSDVLYERALNAVNLKWWDRAADGNLDLVKEMWKTEPRRELLQINWRNPNNHNRSALMICSFRGQNRTAKWLVKEKKARVNGVDDLGCTALNLAARGGCPKLVKFLLENKAKANVPDSNGWTAAVWALTMGHLEVLQTMADMGVSLQDLGRAAPFQSEHMSATTLMPLPCVRYKADQTAARNELARTEMLARAKAHALKQEQMRAEKEAELLGMQEKLKVAKLAEYRHRYMRDARENWHMHEERLKPLVKAERKKNKLLAKQAAETSMFAEY